MTRIVGPLFGTSAVGRIGTIGSFRMGRHGPEFIQHAVGSGGASPAQLTLRACFSAAKAAHTAIVPTWVGVGEDARFIRVPDWPTFWRQWLIDNPGCL